MAKVKAPVTKLNAMHHIGYGAADAGGVLMLMIISYLERFSRNILGIDPIVYAGILVVWNVWDAINDLFALGYQSAAVGYCFGENSDHMPTPDIPDLDTRNKMADNGSAIICAMVERMNMSHVVEQLRKLETYGHQNEANYPWMPSAWNNR